MLVFTGETFHFYTLTLFNAKLADVGLSGFNFGISDLHNFACSNFDFRQVSPHEPELRPRDWGNREAMSSAILSHSQLSHFSC